MRLRSLLPSPTLLCPALACVLASGCYSGHVDADSDDEGVDSGESGDDGGDSGEPSDTFECDPAAVPTSLPLRRLSKVQYENTIRDLLRFALPSEGDGVADGLGTLLAAIPNDAIVAPPGQNHGGFARLDQDVHQEHINAAYDVGRAVGTALTEDPARLQQVVGACATDGDASNDAGCVDDFIRRFGERAMRRPVEDDEVAFFREVFDGEGVTQGMEPQAFADVIAVMLASPQLMYLIEHGEDPVEGQEGAYALGAYELASRLSYHLWQSMPDEELFAAARSGDLLTPEGYQAQVDRLFADARTRASMAEFYRQWLWLDDLPSMDALVGDPRFDAFAGDFAPGPETHEHMRDEVLAMLEYYTFDTPGSVSELMFSNQSFARAEDVAELYGVQPWSGGEPPQLPDAERVGLLTRAALTASGTANTRPIMKGVFIRTALLCQDIPPPPDNAAANPPAPAPNMSTREVVEQLTEQPDTSCMGCHGALINPLGFATENFDALGRFRDEQVLFDDDGQVTTSVPIDTRSVPQVTAGDHTPSAGPADLAQLIVDGGQFQACFARQYLRYTEGRPEDPVTDGCALQDLTTRLEAGAPMAEVLRAIALRPEFQQRQID
ncbi:MAG: DUF1592 domain-containing protein [Myxococcota bacterium]